MTQSGGLWLEWNERGGARRIAVDREITIGRVPGNDIEVDDQAVSRRHCVVSPGAGCVLVDARQSTNLVESGGRQLATLQLRAGEAFTVGRVRFEVAGRETAGVDALAGPLALQWRDSSGSHQLAVAGPLRIGRVPGNDIVLDSPKVSRNHAVIAPAGSTLHIDATGSRNGISSGGRQVEQLSLQRDAHFTIGDTQFRVTQAASNSRVGAHPQGASQRPSPAMFGALAAAACLAVVVVVVGLVLALGGGGEKTGGSLLAQKRISAAEGGVVEVPGGPKVTFPPGALDRDATVTIRAIPAPVTNGRYWPAEILGAVAEISVGAARLRAPATLSLPVASHGGPETPGGTPFISFFDEQLRTWAVVPESSRIESGSIQAEVEHFSTYAVQLPKLDINAITKVFSQIFSESCSESSGQARVDNESSNGVIHGCVQGSAPAFSVKNLRGFPLSVHTKIEGKQTSYLVFPHDAVTVSPTTVDASPIVVSATLDNTVLQYMFVQFVIYAIPHSGILKQAGEMSEAYKQAFRALDLIAADILPQFSFSSDITLDKVKEAIELLLKASNERPELLAKMSAALTKSGFTITAGMLKSAIEAWEAVKMGQVVVDFISTAMTHQYSEVLLIWGTETSSPAAVQVLTDKAQYLTGDMVHISAKNVGGPPLFFADGYGRLALTLYDVTSTRKEVPHAVTRAGDDTKNRWVTGESASWSASGLPAGKYEVKVVMDVEGGSFAMGTVTFSVTEGTQPPVTQPPVTQPPVTQPPVTQPPVTQPPVTQPPVTQPPVTQPPVTQPPVTQPPVTQPPVTQPPVTRPPEVNYTLTLSTGSRTTFSIGDALSLCYRLSPQNVPFQIVITKATDGISGGTVLNVTDNGSGGGDCVPTTVGGPAGTRVYSGQAFVNGQLVASGTVTILVRSSVAPPTTTVPAPAWANFCADSPGSGEIFWGPVTGVGGFRIYRDGALLATLNGGSAPGTAFHSYGAMEGHPLVSGHTYAVAAFSGTQESSRTAAVSSGSCVN